MKQRKASVRSTNCESIPNDTRKANKILFCNEYDGRTKQIASTENVIAF
jgi:hypothetical protein